MNQFNIDHIDVNSITTNEVVDLLVKLFNASKPVSIEYTDVTGRMDNIYFLSFDDVKQDIFYPKDDPDNDTFNIRLPVVKENLYRDNALPGPGFLNKLDPKVVVKGLGLLDVYLVGYESYINPSDNRYLKDRITFNESARFLFDFEENVYVQVPKSEYQSAIQDLRLKNGFQVNQIKNDIVKEYIFREEKLNQLLGLLKPLHFKKTKELFELKSSRYNLADKVTVIDYLRDWKLFLEDIGTWLNLKFFYSHINAKEQKLVKKQSGLLLNKVNKSLSTLNDLPSDLTNAVEMTTYKDDLIYVMNRCIIPLQNSLIERDGNVSGTGYFIFKEEYEVIENFIEIEKRNMLSDEKYTRDEINNEKRLILNTLR
jgi:hypothetical protein